jgi:hypothetical protein
MEKRYLFETFSSDSGSFDGEFTDFLNSKKMEGQGVLILS